jgi:hypothetical protein
MCQGVLQESLWWAILLPGRPLAPLSYRQAARANANLELAFIGLRLFNDISSMSGCKLKSSTPVETSGIPITPKGWSYCSSYSFSVTNSGSCSLMYFRCLASDSCLLAVPSKPHLLQISLSMTTRFCCRCTHMLACSIERRQVLCEHLLPALVVQAYLRCASVA